MDKSILRDEKHIYKPTVSLVLGSGGARGLAHIGVIEVLEEQGFQIQSIAGASIGALIGGVYAAGKLSVYKDWACALQKFDIIKLADWTLSGGGFIKGDRIINVLRELIGDTLIENLPIAYTAVASDLEYEREVWFSRGSLFDAIRASIAIPTLFKPVHLGKYTLVDGGLLNPLPVSSVLHAMTDVTVAVNLNASRIAQGARLQKTSSQVIPQVLTPEQQQYRFKIKNWLSHWFDRKNVEPEPAEMGWRDLLMRSLETMQGAITRMKLATHVPDIMVKIPRNACAFYEFYRAEEMIALGRAQALEALKQIKE